MCTVLVAVIVAATALFVVGVLVERGQGESGTAKHASEASGGERAETHAERGGGHGSEALLGVNPESIPLLIVAVCVSLALAGGVARLPRSLLLLLAVFAAMAAFGALDVREVVHQSDESRTGLAVLAGAVAFLHFSAAGLAIPALRPQSSG